MIFDRLFRSFVPLENPIGFGAADFLELGLAILFAALALTSRPWIEPWAARLAARTRWAMLVLALLPIALRLALLPHHPVPGPESFEEFGHLLAADTLRYFRLANPPHPLNQFFETLYVLQEPVYAAVFPPAQGMALLLGRTFFGNPWAGVILSTAAFCALTYWMLKAWTTPLWALAGGGLAVIQFSALNAWMNTYAGGSVAAAAACLVFGALPRLREKYRPRDAALLGIGLAMAVITQPYQSLFVFFGAALCLFSCARVSCARARAQRAAAWTLAPLIPALALAYVHHQHVKISQYEYGVPAPLTFQPASQPHRMLTPQQDLLYRSEMSYREPRRETLLSYLLRLEFRVRYYRFFFLPALYLVLPFFFLTLRERLSQQAALILLVFALGTNFLPEFQVDHLAAAAPLFLAVSIIAIQCLSRLNREAAWIVLALCLAHFVLWYGVHLFDTSQASQALMRFETWDVINHDSGRHAEVLQELADEPGNHLVFVRYRPQHPFRDEWVYNQAQIDRARLVWARDLGPEENQKLLQYYPDRTAWLLEPDARPPRLEPYSDGK